MLVNGSTGCQRTETAIGKHKGILKVVVAPKMLIDQREHGNERDEGRRSHTCTRTLTSVLRLLLRLSLRYIDVGRNLPQVACLHPNASCFGKPEDRWPTDCGSLEKTRKYAAATVHLPKVARRWRSDLARAFLTSYAGLPLRQQLFFEIAKLR